MAKGSGLGGGEHRKCANCLHTINSILAVLGLLVIGTGVFFLIQYEWGNDLLSVRTRNRHAPPPFFLLYSFPSYFSLSLPFLFLPFGPACRVE